MKILIVGSRGQLGNEIIRVLREGKGNIGEIDEKYNFANILGVDIEELDITYLKDVKAIIYNYEPDLVINSAAYTNVDACENNEELAFKINSLGARNLAIACEKVGAKLVHISTDYVFEGKDAVPYREYDLPHPISVYGKSKYSGEEYVKQFCSRYFIVRTSWLYGYSGNNFVKTIIKAANEKGHLDVVNDQRGNPTNAEDLAYHILGIALTEEYGIYHCTGKGECSWYDFACKIVHFAKLNCSISPIRSDKLNRVAKRPAYSSLDNMMLRCTIGDNMREWEEALKIFIRKLEH